MATFSKIALSASTNGKAIAIQSTGPTGNNGTTVHTAGASSTIDEIWLYAVNYSAASISLTLQWGLITSAQDVVTTIAAGSTGLGPILIVPGLILGNSLVLRAFASVTSSVTVFGYVNRITA